MKKIPLLKINIRDQIDEEEAIIDIDGDIGGWDWEEWKPINTPKSIKKQLKAISKLKAKKIIVNINSLGGFVDDGLAIHDILAQHEAEIETNVIGMTASAATIIAQAGDVRKISDNALYLIHKGWGFLMGNANDGEAWLADMEKIDEKIANIYAKRSGKELKIFEDLMNEDNGGGKWIDAEEAEEFGLVDEVFEPMKAAAAVDPGIFNEMGIPTPKGYGDNSHKIQIAFSVDDEGVKQKIKEIVTATEGAQKTLDNLGIKQEEEKTKINIQNKKRTIGHLKLSRL